MLKGAEAGKYLEGGRGGGGGVWDPKRLCTKKWLNKILPIVNFVVDSTLSLPVVPDDRRANNLSAAGPSSGKDSSGEVGRRRPGANSAWVCLGNSTDRSRRFRRVLYVGLGSWGGFLAALYVGLGSRDAFLVGLYIGLGSWDGFLAF